MDFINTTGSLGIILTAGTQTLTGSIVASLFVLFIFLLAICIMFQIPLEFTAIIVLPFCISVGAYYSNFYLPIIVIIFYVSGIVAKNWLFH